MSLSGPHHTPPPPNGPQGLILPARTPSEAQEICYEGAGLYLGVGAGGACNIHLTDGAPRAKAIEESEVANEVSRLRTAMDELIQQYEKLTHASPATAAAVQSYFTSVDLLRSGSSRDDIAKRIREDLLTAQEAVYQHFMPSIRSFSGFMNDQAHEIRQLMSDLINLLEPGQETRLDQFRTQLAATSGDVILVADCLSPQELLNIDRKRLKGVVLAAPGGLRHVRSIFSALFPGVPLVILEDPALLQSVRTGDPMLVDGRTGVFYVHPSAETMRRYASAIQMSRREFPKISLREHAPKTRDGISLRFTADVVDTSLAHEVAQMDFGGVGLFRTEWPILHRDGWLTADDWYEEFKRLFETVAPRPVIIRTFDFNRTDKPPPRSDIERAAKSGLTGIRLALNVFRPKLIDLMSGAIRASIKVGNNITFLLPMVLDLSDIRRAREAVAEGMEIASKKIGRSINPASVGVGAMLESSAAFRLAPQIMTQVDSVNFGTNDALRSVLQEGDANKATSAYYHPAHLMELRRVLRLGRKLGKSVRVCGDMPNDPMNAPLLVGLGAWDLVLQSHAIGPMNSQLSRCETAPCEELVQTIIKCGAGDTALNLLEEFLKEMPT